MGKQRIQFFEHKDDGMNGQLLSAIWAPSDSLRYVWYGSDLAGIERKHLEIAAQGYILRSLDVLATPSEDVWSAVWERSTAAQEFRWDLDWDGVKSAHAAAAGRGFGPVLLRPYTSPGAGRRWAVLWRSDAEPGELVGASSWSTFWGEWLSAHAGGRHLVCLSTYLAGSSREWSGVFRAGMAEQYIWVGLRSHDFWAKDESLRGDGFSLIEVQSYNVDGVRTWAGCWQVRRTTFVADLTIPQFWAEFERQSRLGHRLEAVHLWHGTAYAPNAAIRRRLRMHLRILQRPLIAVDEMVERMREVYEAAGVAVEVSSTAEIDRPELLDVDVRRCRAGEISAQQETLFGIRSGGDERDLFIYFIRTTLPPFNGCAAHPAARPAVIISSYASAWTLGHEVGHVAGLVHVADATRLMTGLGTANIVDPPPDLDAREIETLVASAIVKPA